MNSMHPGIPPRQRELDGIASFLFWMATLGVPAVLVALICSASWWHVGAYLLALFLTY